MVKISPNLCFPFADELLEIMSLDAPADYPIGFYRNYLNVLLSVFDTCRRSLRELKHLVRVPCCSLLFTQEHKGSDHEQIYKRQYRFLSRTRRAAS